MSQTSDTPTPETDALSPNVREPWSKFAVRCKAFAADMEKQRDAAREDAKRLYKALLIADDDGNYSAQAPGHAIAKAIAAHEALTAKN